MPAPIHQQRQALKAYRLIGRNISRYRKRRGLTQAGLAGKACLHRIYISQVERADRSITIDTLRRITKALRIKLRHVVGDL